MATCQEATEHKLELRPLPTTMVSIASRIVAQVVAASCTVVVDAELLVVIQPLLFEHPKDE